MKLFSCTRCGQRVFFDNVSCETCGAALGYSPDERSMIAFDVGQDGVWQRLGPEGPALKPCDNYRIEHVCNWMVPADGAALHCVSCRTTDTIPVLTKPQNRGYWSLLEHAKRRLFYTLLDIGLPAPGKVDDPVHGLSFQFLEETNPKEKVLTGHDEGVITLNIAEADDALRERTRKSMHEPYRTLLGHFRHESGHYYWDRIVKDSALLDEYRALFGDERADYAEALKKHYATPVPNWHLNFISVYASSHPWEDWAECWAHYLHVLDGLETAAAWGLHLDHPAPGSPAVAVQPVDRAAPSLEASLIDQWLPVSQFVNAMNRSLGLHDSYPFVVPAPVVAKLEFIHRVVSAAARGDVPMNFSALEAASAPVPSEPVPVAAVPATATAPSPAVEPQPPAEVPA